MAGSTDNLDRILDKLVRDVEQAVHALYRGDVRQQTAKAKTDGHRTAARKALAAMLTGAPATPSFSPAPAPALAAAPAGGIAPAGFVGAGGNVTDAESAALMRCIMAWLPMGPPASAAADSRCVPAAKELIPSWGERELARSAVRKLAPRR